MQYVIKRDGKYEPFNAEKIVVAIERAMNSVAPLNESDKAQARYIATAISEQIDHNVSVEDIQDMVETYLMNSSKKDVAKAYILYRAERTKIRTANTAMMKTFVDKLTAKHVQNANANVDEMSFGGRVGEASDALMKQYALDYCMSDMARKNHLENRIYIHDLNRYAIGQHNCLTIPFDDLLAKGFNTRQTDVRPANSISTAFQLLAVIFQIQSLNQFGGVAAGHLDWTMVPYVRKSFYKHYKDGLTYITKLGNETFEDKLITDQTPIDSDSYTRFEDAYKYAMDMTRRELRQAVEGMYHNLNTLQSRSGNQLPFSSINYGTCTLPEGRMVTKALLEGLIEGVGKLHRTSIFPCGIFQYKKFINDKPDTPNYDLFRLALKATALRLYPNYANCDWSGNDGYDPKDPKTYFATMGCRTANGWDINGFGQLKDGRGNICPVTIILPTVAMEAVNLAKENNSNPIGFFMKYLEKVIDNAKDMLIERFNYICSQPADSAKFMYENHVMAGYIPEEGTKSALKHGTLAIGQLGMAEALQILVGCNHRIAKGMDMAKGIEALFARKCKEFKEEYKLNFGVYYTPAESLCYTAMNKFKEKYGVIPDVSDREYFTNSIHIPVWEKCGAFEKIDLESQLTGFSSAGCITYIELESSAKNNIDALETYVTYAMEHDIPYFAINVPNDTCLECGYTDEFNDRCPMCGSTHIQRLRRVTGYLSNDYITTFNPGKQAEVEDRVKHTTYPQLLFHDNE